MGYHATVFNYINYITIKAFKKKISIFILLLYKPIFFNCKIKNFFQHKVAILNKIFIYTSAYLYNIFYVHNLF